jgi:hypothetical protein
VEGTESKRGWNYLIIAVSPQSREKNARWQRMAMPGGSELAVEVHFVQIELEFGSNLFCVELRPGNANSCALTGRNVTCINVVPVHK